MHNRIWVPAAFMFEDGIVFLDEPTAGLDPNQIREVRDMIRRLGENKTILLSTHIMQEVEAMCSRVVFINEGQVRYDGTPEGLRADGRSLDEKFHELSAV